VGLKPHANPKRQKAKGKGEGKIKGKSNGHSRSLRDDKQKENNGKDECNGGLGFQFGEEV
jgi:hypothetical protein